MNGNLSIKEGFELVDREFATKVARKDGRESKLAVPFSLFRRTGSSSSSPPFRLVLAWSPPPLIHRCHALAPARRRLGRSGK